VVMLAVGLWHGANWTFVLWGALHGGLLAAHAAYRRLLNRDALPGSLIGRVSGWALTLIIVTLVWIPFRSANLHEPVVILHKLYQFLQSPTSFTTAVYALPFYIWIAAGFVLLETIDCVTRLELGFARLPAIAQCGIALSLLLLSYLGPAKDVAFLYFQF
jgi:alginate O-acetyltransferase complex protein AlgI